MSDPRLGSERNLADHREEKPFNASDRFFGPPPGKKASAENAAPSTPFIGVKLGKAGNIRPPHRVATVKSDAYGPHLLNLDNTAHCNTVQTATGFAGTYASAARSRDGRLTKKRQDLLVIIKPRLVHLLYRKHHRLNHGSNSSLPGQAWGCVAVHLAPQNAF